MIAGFVAGMLGGEREAARTLALLREVRACLGAEAEAQGGGGAPSCDAD